MNWKETHNRDMKKLQEKLGVDSLDIPIKQLIEFRYKGENYRSKATQLLGRILNQIIELNRGDRLCGMFDGYAIYCFLRLTDYKHRLINIEADLIKNHIPYTKASLKGKTTIACKLDKLDLQDVYDIDIVNPEEMSDTCYEASAALVNQL